MDCYTVEYKSRNLSFIISPETYIRGVDIRQNVWFYGDIFCSNLLLYSVYCNFTDFPILVHLRDVDGRVLAVLPVTETLRHARRQTSVVNAAQSALVIFACGRTGWRRLPTDQYCKVGVDAHETTTGDSDRERRLQLVRDLCLDDETLEPTHVSKRQIPALRDR